MSKTIILRKWYILMNVELFFIQDFTQGKKIAKNL